MSALDKAPPWFIAAVKEIGTREDPGNRGPAIRRYIKLAGYGREGDPWCALFRDAMLKLAGVNKVGNAMARSPETSKNFVKLPGPALGAIITFWRGTKAGGLGHTGFYNGERGDYISCIGGNESDMVREEMFPRAGRAFGLVGYYWPMDYPAMPVAIGACAPVVSNSGAAAMVKATGKVV